MQKVITLLGKPQSTNNLYRSSRRGVYMTKVGRELKKSYQQQAREQWEQKPLEYDKIKVKINLFFDDNRRRDWDNYHKISCDALNGIVWVDDCNITEATVTKNRSPGAPFMTIEVTY